MASPGVRGSALLAIAAAAGLVISLVLIYVVERRAAVVTVPVVVTTQALPKGTLLEAEMVKVVPWPAHLKTFEAPSSTQGVLGRLTRIDLGLGEPLLDSKLRRRGERGDLNDQLGVGERALSVRVNDIVGVPVESVLGHYVDLLLTLPEAQAAASGLPIVERVRVLAVSDTGSPERPQPIRVLTLAVSPEQAAAIERARSNGTLTALLRSQRDSATPSSIPVTAGATQDAPSPRPATGGRHGGTNGTAAPVELIFGTDTVRQ